MPASKVSQAVWDEQPFGQMSDQDLADKLGCSWGAVRGQRARRGIAPFRMNKPIDWDAQPLGQLPDGELAEQLGVSPSAVRYQRQQKGLSRFERVRDWDAQPLGQLTDDALANVLGCSRQLVQLERVKRGIVSKTGRAQQHYHVPLVASGPEIRGWSDLAHAQGLKLGTYLRAVLTGDLPVPPRF